MVRAMVLDRSSLGVRWWDLWHALGREEWSLSRGQYKRRNEEQPSSFPSYLYYRSGYGIAVMTVWCNRREAVVACGAWCKDGGMNHKEARSVGFF